MKLDFYLFIGYLSCICHTTSASRSPIVIAHRGDSGHFPEHCMASYEKVVQDNSADMLEVDLALTKDLEFVALHEPMLGATTDVGNQTQFASRKRPGQYAYAESRSENYTDWWVDDFTLDELMQLRRVQRYSFRDQSKNGIYPIATLKEILHLVNEKQMPVMLEIKNPLYYNAVIRKRLAETNSTVENLLVEELKSANLKESDSLIYLQTFYLPSAFLLRTLAPSLPVIYLTGMLDTVTDKTLHQLHQKGIHGLGLWKGVIDQGYTDNMKYKYFISQDTDIIQRAKQNYNLAIYIWTFRLEDEYLPWSYGQDYVAELQRFWEADIDGFITDFPLATRRFLKDKTGIIQSSGESILIVNIVEIILLFTAVIGISHCLQNM
jgi:glycerophosphoryl diester phosphodiesterase